MAEGWLRHFAAGRAEVFSAGIEAHGLNPRAVDVMREAGIDISSHTSKTIDELPERDFDIVITVCDNAREHCPYFPARVRQLHHDFQDPTGTQGSEEHILAAFRSTRDQIKTYCQTVVIQHLRTA